MRGESASRAQAREAAIFTSTPMPRTRHLPETLLLTPAHTTVAAPPREATSATFEVYLLFVAGQQRLVDEPAYDARQPAPF